jgi:hypothetical protein
VARKLTLRVWNQTGRHCTCRHQEFMSPYFILALAVGLGRNRDEKEKPRLKSSSGHLLRDLQKLLQKEERRRGKRERGIESAL